MKILIDSLTLVGGSVTFALIGLTVVRKCFRGQDFKGHHEIAGYLFSVVGTLYAVLLGLIVVNVQTKFDEARQMAQTEASSCSDIWQLTRCFPDEKRRPIRLALRDYYAVVQSEDWDAVSEGRITEQSVPAYQDLWRTVTHANPQNNAENACFSSIIECMKSLSDARRYRMVAHKRLLSPIVWAVLAIGAALTIVFTYFFWIENVKIQIALTTLVAVFVSLNLLLVKLFENPYRQELLVKHGAFTFKPDILAPGKSPAERRAERVGDGSGADGQVGTGVGAEVGAGVGTGTGAGARSGVSPGVSPDSDSAAHSGENAAESPGPGAGGTKP